MASVSGADADDGWTLQEWPVSSPNICHTPASVSDDVEDNSALAAELAKLSIPELIQKVEELGEPFVEPRLGEKSDAGSPFCPWRLVTNYPELFVGKRNGSLVRFDILLA